MRYHRRRRRCHCRSPIPTTVTVTVAVTVTSPPQPLGRYGCDVDETKIISTMDSIVALGLRDVGYEYVNLDDWYVGWVE
jgi:hypothetical protein